MENDKIHEILGMNKSMKEYVCIYIYVCGVKLSWQVSQLYVGVFICSHYLGWGIWREQVRKLKGWAKDSFLSVEGKKKKKKKTNLTYQQSTKA